MYRWKVVLSSNLGLKQKNDDFVSARIFTFNHHRITALVACDGISSLPNSDICASEVGKAILHVLESYLATRQSKGALSQQDADSLAAHFEKLPLTLSTDQGATTITLAVYEHRWRKSGFNLLVISGGDSRAYLLGAPEQMQQLTSDHNDEQGAITVYISGTGDVKGELQASHFRLKSAPAVIIVCTDGVHDHCSHKELHNFVRHCVEQNLRNGDELSDWMTQFLGRNISDNYSAAILFRLGLT